MYKQYYPWYDFWLQYVTNWDEVKDNCLNVPGVGCESRSNWWYLQRSCFQTQLIYIPFELNLQFNSSYYVETGLYKLVMTLTSFDRRTDTKSSAPICFEIIADVDLV